jgi:large subunit ribosomal protein L4e
MINSNFSAFVYMKAQVLSIDGKPKGEVQLGKAFQIKIRSDVVQRAFVSEHAAKRQPYGTDPLAGDRSSAHYHGRRAIKNSMMNREMARMKRIHGQGYLNFTARVVPHATKGRRAHPPKVEKVWKKKINKKERLLALMSALSASTSKDFVLLRGHKANGLTLPLVVEDSFEHAKNTKEVVKILMTLGLSDDLLRSSKKKVRAGRGKTRGRKYRTKKGPLLVVSNDSFKKTVKNIPGVDVATPKELNLTLLAPGGQPGRLTLFTQSSVEELNKL